MSHTAKSKAAARHKANVYQSRGHLIPQPCEVCGATPAEKHHDDYDKPLDVRWLCFSHHMELHRGYSLSLDPHKHIIHFRVSVEEYAQLSLWACERGISVSQVVRDKLFTQDAQRSHAATGAGGNRRSARGKAQEANSHAIVAPSRSVSQMAEVKMAPAAEGRCAHGKRAGEVCYKCDERFGFPGLSL